MKDIILGICITFTFLFFFVMALLSSNDTVVLSNDDLVNGVFAHNNIKYSISVIKN